MGWQKEKEKRKIRAKERYEYLKKIGRCTKCGKNEAIYKRTLCYECTEKKIEYERKTIYTDKYREYRRIKGKEFREKRIKEGKCPRCGKIFKSDKYVNCDNCRAKKRSKESPSVPVRQVWIDNGICFSCGRENAIKDKKLCKVCYEKSVLSIENARKYIDREHHIFRKDNDISINATLYFKKIYKKNNP